MKTTRWSAWSRSTIRRTRSSGTCSGAGAVKTRSHAPRGNVRSDAPRRDCAMAETLPPETEIRDAERRQTAFPRGAWERGPGGAPSPVRAWLALVAVSLQRQARMRQMVWIALGLLLLTTGIVAAIRYDTGWGMYHWRWPRRVGPSFNSMAAT